MSLQENILATLPPLTTRAEKERWVYTKPTAFTRQVPAQQQTLNYTPAATLEHTLAADTWHHGTWALDVAADQAQTVIEVVTGGGDATLMTDTLTVNLAANSQLTHIRLHAGTGHKQRRVVNVTAETGATYRQFTLDVGATLTRNETYTDLIGEGAHVEAVGLALLRGTEKTDALAHTRFLAPNCTADIRQRHVVADAAHGVFQGKFFVDQTAQKTDAYMLTQNMLLGEQASASHKPELEIYADDVKCSHGATTGTLDDDHLFYLQARGIPAAQAKQMLVAAQVHDMLTNLPDSITVRALGLAEHWLKEVSRG